MDLPKYSMGIGDRFAHQGRAQLAAFVKAKQAGVDVTPVWNKSNREHLIVGSEPGSVRDAADGAVKELGWKMPYHVDADHINLSTVERFIDASDFYTIDVASAIGQFMSALQPVTDLLDELEKALRDIKITIPIPFYPVTVSLYDVFENFSAFIDLAMAPIQDLVNQIISALHIPLPQIPGLQDIINLLNINLPAIPDFTGLTQAVSDAIAQLQTGFNLFHLDCPPKT